MLFSFVAACLGTYVVDVAVVATPRHPGIEPAYLVGIFLALLICAVFVVVAITGEDMPKPLNVLINAIIVFGVVLLMALAEVDWPLV